MIFEITTHRITTVNERPHASIDDGSQFGGIVAHPVARGGKVIENVAADHLPIRLCPNGVHDRVDVVGDIWRIWIGALRPDVVPVPVSVKRVNDICVAKLLAVGTDFVGPTVVACLNL